MKSQKYAGLNIKISFHSIHIFNPVIQKGFYVKSIVGIPVMEFLIQCGLDREYINSNIKTVFLDSKPVDNLENAIIKDNSILSLSGAMPGLVGAVMRIDSPFQSFRNTISYVATVDENSFINKKTGMVAIKLFNTVLSDTAVLFLQKGIYIDGKTLLSLIKENKNVFKKKSICYNNKQLLLSEVIAILKRYLNNLLYVSVTVID